MNFNISSRNFVKINEINKLKINQNYLIRHRIRLRQDFIAKYDGFNKFTIMWHREPRSDNTDPYNTWVNAYITNTTPVYKNYILDIRYFNLYIYIFELGETGQSITFLVSPNNVTNQLINKEIDLLRIRLKTSLTNIKLPKNLQQGIPVEIAKYIKCFLEIK